MSRRRMLIGSGWITAVIACGPIVTGAPDATSSGPSESVGTGSRPPATESGAQTGSVGTTTSGEPTTSTGVGETARPDVTDDGTPFIIPPDGGGMAIECHLWEPDCPRGEKCMPWSNDGGSSWNATKCTPIARDPADVGEPCTVVDDAWSGIDDCVAFAMCWEVDAETNMGTCVGFCTGSRAEPSCPDGGSCYISGEGTLILCLPVCDPLLQDCEDGAACYPINDGFECDPDVSGRAGAVGDPCELVGGCDPGLYCASPDVVPGCEGSGCCAALCDLSDAGASAACDASLPGAACEPWYEPGQAPPGYEDVGACIVL